MIQYCYTIWQLVKSNRKPHIRSSKYFPEFKTADKLFCALPCFLLISLSSARLGWGSAAIPLLDSSRFRIIGTDSLNRSCAGFNVRSLVQTVVGCFPITAVVTFQLGSLLSSGSADPPAPWQPRRPALRRTGAGAAGAAGPGDSSGGPRWTGPRWT